MAVAREPWRDETCRHRAQPRFGRTVWAWIKQRAKLSRDDPGSFIRRIVEREFEQEAAVKGGPAAAEAAGREAFTAGKSIDEVPSGYLVTRGLRLSWEKGYEDAARAARGATDEALRAKIKAQADAVAALEAAVAAESPPVGCPSCGRSVLADGTRAVTVPLIFGASLLECRGCKHRFARK